MKVSAAGVVKSWKYVARLPGGRSVRVIFLAMCTLHVLGTRFIVLQASFNTQLMQDEGRYRAVKLRRLSHTRFMQTCSGLCRFGGGGGGKGC